jgi:hypothetical protein
MVVRRVVLLDGLKSRLVIEWLIIWMLCCLISKVVVWKGCFAGAREGAGKFARTNLLNTWGNILPTQGLVHVWVAPYMTSKAGWDGRKPGNVAKYCTGL